MKKIINKPENFVEDMLEGICAAHSDQLRFVNDDMKCMVSASADNNQGKVGLVSGGGSGHLPLFIGYVGDGMLDGCAAGGVFQSPSGNQVFEVTKAVNRGAGVLYIYGNYNGDIMSFEMSSEMAEMHDIPTLHTVVCEDVSSSPKGEEHKRRGVAGLFFVFKCAGAKALEKAGLEEVKRIADKTASNMRTMGVALSPCIVPEVGKPSFHLGEDEMEIGMGLHGEPGINRTKIMESDVIVEKMLHPVLQDLPFVSGDEVAVLVNGLGATPKEELYIMYGKISKMLSSQGIKVFHVYAGEFATSMEMAGASITLLKLDEELKALLARPANTPFFVQQELSL